MTAALAVSAGLLAYVFAGYPAAAWLLARVRPRPVRLDPSYEPRVSLVVLAWNEEDLILDRLRNVAELDYPPDRLEVIVVADGSTDATADRARSVPGTIVLHDPARGGKLAAMNRGADVASGEILLFSDANNRYTRETVRELVAPFADAAVGVVGGRKAIDDGSGRPLDRAEGLYWRYEARLKQWENARGSVAGVPGEIVAFRREAYQRPRPGTMNDDFVQAMMAALAGWRVAYAHDAVSLERASASLGGEAIRRTRLTTGRLQAVSQLLPALVRRRPALAWRVLSHKGLRPAVPFCLLVFAASSAFLAPSRPWALVLVVLQVAFYGAAVLGWTTERRRRRSRWLYLPYYFCRMNLATLAGFRDFARRRREAVWAKVERA